MKLTRKLVLLGVFVGCLLQLNHAQARGPSTSSERARVIELTRSLERNPLREDAATTRQWLRDWIAEVPDIRFRVCPDLIGHELGDNYPYLNEINQQVMFASAAFVLERQDKARDVSAVYTAGVEGALRVYAVIVQSKPAAKSAFLDDLIAKRDEGQLFDYVAQLASERCKEQNMIFIALPIGAAVGFMLALPFAWWFGRRRADRVATPERMAMVTRSRILQAIVFICAAYYVTAGIALHALQPEYDPRFRFMSEYAWGPYGWLMTTTFFVLGLAIVTVAIGLRESYQPSRSARIGFGLLLVAALGICLAGVFREFIPHAAASAVGLPSVVIAALLLSWSFRRSTEWQPIYPVALVITIAMLATFLSAMFDLGLPGLQQRAFLFLVLLWLVLVIHRIHTNAKLSTC